MAKLGDLILNIGANTKQLDKSLGKVRRQMKSFGRNFKALGRDLTRSVTLPLAALGAAAIKSAVDLEKLETSFVSLTGGTREAAAMMKQLNDFTAQTPFQIDAVANSARQLIASGTKISEVNDQLQFLGDIAATSGSEINEIAAIFAKVNAKGKVELENLNQLAERGIPVFKALSDATGLLPSELGAGAVSVKEFNKVLKSFAEEGGFANGAMERLSQTAAGKFSTAIDNLKIAGAGLVESLMPIISDVIDGITSMAQKFAKSSPEFKKTILVIGGVVAAIGPLLVIIPSLGAALSFLSGPIGIAVLAIGALSFAVGSAMLEMRSMTTQAQSLDGALAAVNKQVAHESAEAKVLFARLKDVNLAEDDRNDVIQRLQTNYGDYLGNLDLNNAALEDIEKAERKVITAIGDRVRAQVLAAAQTEVINKQIKLETMLLEAELAAVAKGFDAGEVGKRVAFFRENIESAMEFEDFDMIANLNWKFIHGGEIDKALGDEILGNFSAPFLTTGQELIKSTTALNNLITVIDRIEKVTEPSELPANIEDVKDEFVELEKSVLGNVEPLKLLTRPLNKVKKDLAGVTASVRIMSPEIGYSLDHAAKNAENFAERVEQAMEQAAEAMVITTATMIGAAIATREPLEGMGVALLEVFANLAVELGTLAIGYGITIEAIKEALRDLGGTPALVAGIALVALGAGLKGRIAKAADNAGMPALAQGGLAYGPTTAIVGDNKNAAIDPEVIAPLSKLRDLMAGSGTQVYGRISGDDILISNARAMRDRNRM
jgi:tape measure domain-containing protein